MTNRRKKAPGRSPAGLPPLTPEAEAALRQQVTQAAEALAQDRELSQVLDLIQTHPGDPLWDLHLIGALEHLAQPGTPRLLAALFAAVSDKPRRKALKRAMHHLKTRGLEIPAEALPREEAVMGAPRGATAALVSPVLGNGDSYVVLEGPAEILGGNFLVSRIHDVEGFRECHLLNLKRKQQDEFWDQFRQQGLLDWFPVPSPFAVRLLEEALGLDPQAGGAARYSAWRGKILQHWGRPEAAPELDEGLPEVSSGEQSRLLEESRNLASAPLFHSWLPSLEEITPWVNRLKEVQESPLVLTEAQRTLRLDTVVDEATRALYPPQTRSLWRRRLRTMAYYLNLRGSREEARAAVAAADQLTGEPGALTGENPFLKALVQFSLRLGWETLEKPREAEPSSGLVAPPGESLIIRR